VWTEFCKCQDVVLDEVGLFYVAATFKVMKMCSEIAVPGLVPFGV
jgi:hypothetical protein